MRAILFLCVLVLAASAATAQPRGKRRAPTAGDNLPVRNPPELDRFFPETGVPGCEVTLKGKNFDDTTSVRFNGRALQVISRNPTELKVRIPTGPAVASDRFVISKSGFTDVTADKVFGVVRPPVIASFSPTRGAPGTAVTLSGQHFLSGDEFVLGETTLRTGRVAATRATVTIPDGAASGRFGIRREGKLVASARASFEVTGQAPQILAFAPQGGPRGTVVHITGKNFLPSDRIELDGRRLEVRARGADFVDVVIGSHGSGRFVLLGADGRRAESGGSFRVMRPLAVTTFAPNFGPPGTRVTIDGAGFQEGDSVVVGAAVLTVRRISESSIVAELPAGVQSGPVCVQRGRQRHCARGRFEVLLPPAILALTPLSAPPGATVTISGRNFLPDTSVLLSGQQLPILRRRLPEEVLVQIPADARSGRLTVVTKAGSAQSPVLFQVTRYAEISSFFPLHALPGAKVTIRGAHFHPGLKAFLGELQLPEVSRRPGELVVRIPAGARSGPIVLESYGKKLPSGIKFTVDEPKPEIEFVVTPTSGARGSEVTITVSPPRDGITVFFDGRPLPKRVLQGGRVLVVTIPSDARSGHFELELEGQRYRSKQVFRVR